MHVVIDIDEFWQIYYENYPESMRGQVYNDMKSMCEAMKIKYDLAVKRYLNECYCDECGAIGERITHSGHMGPVNQRRIIHER